MASLRGGRGVRGLSSQGLLKVNIFFANLPNKYMLELDKLGGISRWIKVVRVRKVREADLSSDVFSAKHQPDKSVKQRGGGKNVAIFFCKYKYMPKYKFANTSLCKNTNL